MAEVCIALSTKGFYATHAMAGVGFGAHGFGIHRRGKTRPTGAGFKLGRAVKQFRAATRAAIGTVFMVVPILPREGRLGTLLASYMVLLRSQLFAPLFVGLLYFFHCTYSLLDHWIHPLHWNLAQRPRLSERTFHPDPLEQFRRWFRAVKSAGLPEPNAMTLATSAPGGRPSARMVLLKGVTERGFVFFTNYESRKGRELAANPRAALVFYWREVNRQVRVIGRVSKLSAAESDAYFATRPHAQAAWPHWPRDRAA